MLRDSQVKSPQNISGASQQNWFVSPEQLPSSEAPEMKYVDYTTWLAWGSS